MSLAVAEKIIKDSLAADPRTADIRVSRNGSMVSLTHVATESALASQTDDDILNGRGLAGTKIMDRYEPDWKGVIVSVKRTNYIVERTQSRSGRGEAGKRFRMPMTRCVLDK